ncbi:MAG: hypothetical protein ACSLFI_07385 [Solirubrobacterales bacterium]
MLIPVTFFIALAVAVFSYSQGQGGPIAGLLFFGILFIGAFIQYSQPLIDMVKPHLPMPGKNKE